mgnify:CR=1 FL=1
MIFIDTWGFIAFVNKKETKHNDVVKLFADIWNNNQPVYTSDYILDETITLLSRKLDFKKVKDFVLKIDEAISGGFINILWILKPDFDTAIKKRLKYKDKLDISFTDLTTAVLMEKLGINKIITEDSHFNYLNKNFEVLF